MIQVIDHIFAPIDSYLDKMFNEIKGNNKRRIASEIKNFKGLRLQSIAELLTPLSHY